MSGFCSLKRVPSSDGERSNAHTLNDCHLVIYSVAYGGRRNHAIPATHALR